MLHLVARGGLEDLEQTGLDALAEGMGAEGAGGDGDRRGQGAEDQEESGHERNVASRVLML